MALLPQRGISILAIAHVPGRRRATLAQHAEAISLERLPELFGEVFGLRISEGAVVNLIRRVRARRCG